MNIRSRVVVIMGVSLLVFPELAAAVCFSVTGLPEAAGLDLSPLAPSLRGHAPIVGEAHGVCGLGEPPALVEGAARVDPGGSARVALKMIAARPGCGSGELEVVLPPPFGVGTGQLRLPEGSVANVRLIADPSDDACRVRNPRPAACVGNATTLCLQQNRFRITATAASQTGPLPAQVLKFTGETGHASSEPGNVELTIKILNACALNDRYWVSYGALSNVEYTITVTDTQTGQTKSYFNPLGRAGLETVDTLAFATCP